MFYKQDAFSAWLAESHSAVSFNSSDEYRVIVDSRYSADGKFDRTIFPVVIEIPARFYPWTFAAPGRNALTANCETYTYLNRFVVPMMERTVGFQLTWGSFRAVDRSGRRFPIARLREVVDLTRQRTTGMVYFCTSRFAPSSFQVEKF